MGTNDHRSALAEQVSNGREGSANTGIISDGSTLQGHIEVGAQQHALASERQISNGALHHAAPAVVGA